MVGSNGNAKRVGNCVLVPEGSDFLFASFLISAKPADQDTLDPNYLFNFLRSEMVQSTISDYVQGSTGLKNIDLGVVRNASLALPPISEQRRIAEVLASLDYAIEAAQAVIKQLQVVKEAMLTELLTRGIPGRHKQFKTTNVGNIPKAWDLAPLEDLGRFGEQVVRSGPFGSSMKTKDFRPNGRPVLSIQSLGEGRVLPEGLFYVDDKKAAELYEYRVQRGDLVFSRVADIGRSVAIEEESSGWLISPNLMRIRLDPERVDARFAMYSITIGRVARRQIEGIADNSGRQVVSSAVLKRLLLVVPPLAEQVEIASVGQKVEERLDREMASLEALRTMKFALLPALLTGEIRVPLDSLSA